MTEDPALLAARHPFAGRGQQLALVRPPTRTTFVAITSTSLPADADGRFRHIGDGENGVRLSVHEDQLYPPDEAATVSAFAALREAQAIYEGTPGLGSGAASRPEVGDALWVLGHSYVWVILPAANDAARRLVRWLGLGWTFARGRDVRTAGTHRFPLAALAFPTEAVADGHPRPPTHRPIQIPLAALACLSPEGILMAEEPKPTLILGPHTTELLRPAGFRPRSGAPTKEAALDGAPGLVWPDAPNLAPVDLRPESI